MSFIQPKDRNQYIMLNTLDDLISYDNEVRLFDAFITHYFTANPAYCSKETVKGSSASGRPAYSPQTMHKLYLYGYMNKIKSSRNLEKECHRNIELIWLLGDLRPDFKTIADFRKDNHDQIIEIERSFRQFLSHTGYIEGYTIAIDGSKIKANTRRDMLTQGSIEKRIKKLNYKIEDYLSQLDKVDKEDDLEEEDNSSKYRDLLEKISKLEKRIEELETHSKELERLNKKYFSPSDKEANLMKTRDGLQAAYNVQMGVDSKHKLITGVSVITEQNDLHQLKPMVEKIENELSITPKEILADTGYSLRGIIKQLEEEKGISCYIPLAQSKAEKIEVEFTYNKESDEYICSEGKRLPLKSKNKKKREQYYDAYQGIECNGCSIREQCTQSKYGRILHISHQKDWDERYKKKLHSSFGKEKIRKRRELAEHPFGTLKQWMGKRPLLLRGIRKVETEISLHILAYNFRRMINIKGFEALKDEIERYKWATS